MRKALISIGASLALFGAFLAFSGVATADHRFSHWDEVTPASDRIHFFPVCFIGGFVYPADTGFFVAHGWLKFAWSETPPEEKRAFNHPTTTFMLAIDGVPQKSAYHAGYDPSTDVKDKWFVTEIHKGLPAGLYVFTYTWTIDGALDGGDFRDAHFAFGCTGTVTFL